MPKRNAPRRRTVRPRVPGGFDAHLDEWIETLDELHELTDDEVQDLMRLAANANGSDDDDA